MKGAVHGLRGLGDRLPLGLPRGYGTADRAVGLDLRFEGDTWPGIAAMVWGLTRLYRAATPPGGHHKVKSDGSLGFVTNLMGDTRKPGAGHGGGPKRRRP